MTFPLKTICLIITLSCSLNQGSKIFNDKKEKDSWSQDSCGCLGYRSKLYLQVRTRIEGMSLPEVENNLGTPNKKTKHDLKSPTSYYYTISTKCDSSQKIISRGFDLILLFKNDTVVSASNIIY